MPAWCQTAWHSPRSWEVSVSASMEWQLLKPNTRKGFMSGVGLVRVGLVIVDMMRSFRTTQYDSCHKKGPLLKTPALYQSTRLSLVMLWSLLFYVLVVIDSDAVLASHHEASCLENKKGALDLN